MQPVHVPRVSGLFEAPVALLPLLDELPMAVAVLSPDRRVVAMNQAAEALTGCTRKEARLIPCRHVFRSNLCLTGCPLRTMAPDSEPVSMEGDIISRDRLRIPVRVTFAPVLDMSGKLAGYLETIEDIRLLQELGSRKAEAFTSGHMIGKSPQMERVFRILPGISQTDSSVLITGETGTGKDVLAEAIHMASGRAKGPFVKVNCGALPESLLESELFGHRKGAFTGASEDKPGRFRMAQNGTLFLTEIGDLPLPLQVKLLTFLDDRIIYPLGSARGSLVDVRVIAATHRDLEQMVREERFRQDLLFRLNVVRVHLPPLREREDDVRLLLDHFLRSIAGQFAKNVQGFSRGALELLTAYSYPGNVRELRNIVEYAVNICEEDRIRERHLPAYLTECSLAASIGRDCPAERVTGAEGRDAAPSRLVDAGSGDRAWPEVERSMILDALVRAGGKKTRAAEMLGWGRSTLWRKIKHYGIDQ